jgi:hypothetical protein
VVVDRVNQRRDSFGLDPVTRDDELARVANNTANKLAANEELEPQDVRLDNAGCESGNIITVNVQREVALANPGGSGNIYVDSPEDFGRYVIRYWSQPENGQATVQESTYTRIGVGITLTEQNTVQVAALMCT